MIDDHLETHRKLYNLCVEERRNRFVSWQDQIKRLIRPIKLDFGGSYSALQQTVRRCDKAFKNHYNPRMRARKPRFKKRFQSIEFSKHGDGWSLCRGQSGITKFEAGKNKRLYIKGIGNIRINLHRNIENPVRLTLLKKHGFYYATITCELTTLDGNSSLSKTSVGIDFNFKNFVATSDGKLYRTNIDFRKFNRQIDKANRKGRKDVVAKIHKKLANKMKDFHHKLANQLISDVIVMEDFTVQSWKTKIPNVNRALYHLGFNHFKTILTYKAESAGSRIVLVNPMYTSQRCSNCGNVSPKRLTKRKHFCSCGLKLDRDINAAKNILALGLQSVENGETRFNKHGLYESCA